MTWLSNHPATCNMHKTCPKYFPCYKKCVFGVDSRKCLGFMLTQREVKANLEKCKAIIEMRSPTNVKEVQGLVGHLTAISRFLPKLVEQTQPIIQLLKKYAKFSWNDDCEKKFPTPPNYPYIPSNPPQTIRKPPTTSIYHCNRLHGQCHRGPKFVEIQHPVYFVSRTLQDPKIKYQMVEKLALSSVLGMATGRERVSLSHTHPHRKNSSPSPYPNPTGIKLLSHPHPHRVTSIISYPYPYPFSYYFNINFN